MVTAVAYSSTTRDTPSVPDTARTTSDGTGSPVDPYASVATMTSTGYWSSSAASSDVRALAAPVDIMATSVTPMRSAVLVAVVRRGLRSVFAVARRAVDPVPASSRPTNATTAGSQ